MTTTLTCTSTHCERRQECASPNECSGSAKRPIPFTQFIPPHGKRRETSFEVSPAIHEKAMRLIAYGLRFECEILSTGEVSLTLTDPVEGDLDIRVVENGPLVRDAVESLVLDYSEVSA